MPNVEIIEKAKRKLRSKWRPRTDVGQKLKDKLLYR